MELAMTGRLLKSKGTDGQDLLKFEIKERKQAFILAPGKDEETIRTYFELSKQADSEKTFWVRGRVHTHAKADPGLVVGRFRIKKK